MIIILCQTETQNLSTSILAELNTEASVWFSDIAFQPTYLYKSKYF